MTELNQCTFNDFNRYYMNQLISKCKQVQLSKKVAEKINNEVLITNNCINTIITNKVKKANHKSNDCIKKLEEALKLYQNLNQNVNQNSKKYKNKKM